MADLKGVINSLLDDIFAQVDDCPSDIRDLFTTLKVGGGGYIYMYTFTTPPPLKYYLFFSPFLFSFFTGD